MTEAGVGRVGPRRGCGAAGEHFRDDVGGHGERRIGRQAGIDCLVAGHAFPTCDLPVRDGEPDVA